MQHGQQASEIDLLRQLVKILLTTCLPDWFQLPCCSRMGPFQWIQLARVLHDNRATYDAFLVVHGAPCLTLVVFLHICTHHPGFTERIEVCSTGTDTMAYTACALSLMLAGFRKPIILTGSQLPLIQARSDARQNLVDSLTGADCTPRWRLHRPALAAASFARADLCALP